MIAEPMTLITDYLMAGVTGSLGWRLYLAREGQTARFYWASGPSQPSSSVRGAYLWWQAPPPQ